MCCEVEVGADDGGRGSGTAICGSRCGNGSVKSGLRRGRLLFRLPAPADDDGGGGGRIGFMIDENFRFSPNLVDRIEKV